MHLGELCHRGRLSGWQALGEAIAGALGFEPASGGAFQGKALVEVGRCAAAAAPVFLGLGDPEALLRDIGKFAGLRGGPFLLLTPTGMACVEEVEQVLVQHGAAHISLSSILGALPGGTFEASESAAPAVANFVERVARSRHGGAVLSSIHREIASARSEFVELRSAKQRLEKMMADGLFAFTQKVDAHSFKILCAILAEGDVAKASRTLAMPDASLRNVLTRCRSMGKEYRVMLDLVRWRKAVGRKEVVALNDNVLLGRAEREEYPEQGETRFHNSALNYEPVRRQRLIRCGLVSAKCCQVAGEACAAPYFTGSFTDSGHSEIRVKLLRFNS